MTDTGARACCGLVRQSDPGVRVRALGVSSVPTAFFFFFSSRRRHTRCPSDWSSDVCSSDLLNPFGEPFLQLVVTTGANRVLRNCCSQRAWSAFGSGIVNAGSRSGHGVAITFGPGWLLQEASLWPLTHRHPPCPSPLIGPQSPRSLMGASP